MEPPLVGEVQLYYTAYAEQANTIHAVNTLQTLV